MAKAVVSSSLLKGLRERLVNIDHPDVRLWEDEDLITAVFENSSKWIELLKWLLIALDDSLASSLENLEESDITQSLQDVVLSLGILPSSESLTCVSGKVNIKARESLCNTIIRAIESKRKYSQDYADELQKLTKKTEIFSFEEYEAFGSFLNVKKEKSSKTYEDVLTCIETDKKLKELLTEKLDSRCTSMQSGFSPQFPSSVRNQFQEKDENLTAVQYLEMLKEERKIKLADQAALASSVEELWKGVHEMYNSEFEPLLPVKISEAKKMPMLKQLSNQIDFISEHQKKMQIVEESVHVLQERSTIDREQKWSVTNTDYHPMHDLMKQIHSVSSQIRDLSVKPESIGNTC